METHNGCMFMKDEIDGILYTIPGSSIAWRHTTAQSRVQWSQWVDHVVNSKRDIYAFTNAEMVISVSGSASPTCILKHHSGKGYIYAQVLEIDSVTTNYKEYGVNNKTIGSLLLWPLSYNQHTIVWSKISEETPLDSSLRAFPPIEPDFLTLTNDGRFSGPETRPRPCLVEGAYTTQIAYETTAADRFALLMNATSRYLFRDGKARNERYRRATRRFIEDLPDRQAHKSQLANQTRKRQREDRQEMKALYNGASNLCSMSAFIKNVPRVIKELRVISGMPIASRCAVKSARTLESSHTSGRHETNCGIVPFGNSTNALPQDIQAMVLRRCASSILSDPDTDRSRQHAYELSAVCTTTRTLLFEAMGELISDTCERTVECLQTGAKNNPAKMARLTYTTLSCSPLLLLDIARRNNVRETRDKDLIRLYYSARMQANTCKQVCAARAKPNQGTSAMAAMRSVSSVDLDDDDITTTAKESHNRKPYVPMTRRFEELWDTFNK